MPVTVHGYAAPAAKEPLEPFTFERRDPRPDDVSIKILYCGVCHSDIHHSHGDWSTMFPLVPGHEIVGKVTAVGSEVKNFKVGDLAGVGCLVDSCRDCSMCEIGLEQFCQKGNTLTYASVDKHDGRVTYGGYSEMIIVSERFVLHVPENIDISAAPPLLCAGITTWSPLRHWKVGKDSVVAVVGLGGLGHMAIKLAKALGAKVSLFTRSTGKVQDAYKLGADEVIFSTKEDEMKAAAMKFDLIVDTVPCAHDLNQYINTLKVDGTIVLVGHLGELTPPVDSSPLVLGRRSVAGSPIGGLPETQELLDFCGEHNIVPDVEMIRMDQINEAYERMLRDDVKYRFVIDMSTLNKKE